jgi:hypothetical protein
MLIDNSCNIIPIPQITLINIHTIITWPLIELIICPSPPMTNTLKQEEKCNALTSLMFLTEKHSGEIKACACANGNVQCNHIAKEVATSPTVTSEAIPGAFLQTENPDYVLMRLDGILAKIMVKVAPALYHKHISAIQKGKPVLYVQLEKAVYGTMKSMLLFYCKLVADLTP